MSEPYPTLPVCPALRNDLSAVAEDRSCACTVSHTVLNPGRAESTVQPGSASEPYVALLESLTGSHLIAESGLARSMSEVAGDRRARTSRRSVAPPPRTVKLFGWPMAAVRMAGAVETLLDWIWQGEDRCRYVVTPNVDHLVLLEESAPLREAYRAASLILADGMPVVVASRWLGATLPERVSGADLVPALFEAATIEQPITVYLLGAGPGVAERAAGKIEQQWPGVQVVGWDSPPKGFEHDPEENRRIIERVNAVQPDLVVLGFGAPKQELWIHAHADALRCRVALCVGATIDFLAGEKKRAPHWLGRMGLEWLHRMLSEPRRLCRRYARDAWIFPRLFVREWMKSWWEPCRRTN